MMVLVIGGSGSGKSAYAEEVAVSLSNRNDLSEEKRDEKTAGRKKYYLATMQVFDEEGQRRVERHRQLRAGKGFLTIEQPTKIQEALEKMETGECVALLECISNLTANEMFTQKGTVAEAQVIEAIVNGVALLQKKVAHLVVVSNNVFEDGIIYDKATMGYIHAMGEVNQRLALLADQVVEVVVEIPVSIK